jgi:hypothetical protein
MTSRCALGGFAAAALVGWGLLWVNGRAAPERQAPPAGASTGPEPASLGFAGAGSCSGQGCHGRAEPVKAPEPDQASAQLNEYTFCLTYDKHTRAYQVLKEKRASVMADNLAPTNPGGKRIEPYRDQRCLACHTTPEAAHQPNPEVDVNPLLLTFRAEGVSCEACHGPAKKKPKPWLAIHTAPDKWRKKYEKTPQDPAWKEYAFTNLSDLRVQAETCAGCHVGAPADAKRGIPARDAHHDIMAAGHPRLNFELTTFRANMPPHWNVARKEKSLKPGVYEAKSWAVGQVVSARAALDLLMHRTKQATTDENKPGITVRWPEFAEYRCFACHADLHPEWRNRKAPVGRIVGSLPYDPWYNTMLPGLFKTIPGPQEADLAKLYSKLASDMATPGTTPARRATIGEAADAILKDLNGWLGEYSQKEYDPAKMLQAVLAAAGTPTTWEQAEQLTLAIAALKHAQLAEYSKQLKDVAEALAFPDLAPPDKAESPAGFTDPFADKSRARAQLQSLLEALRK